jgi:O-antigen/teichoic acid export membrane protein
LGALAPEVVELMFGGKWLEASPYVAVLACLIVVQAPRILIAPMLTAIGRPADSMIGRAVELSVMLAALLASGVPTLESAMTIWVARELIGFPVMGFILQRATGLGAVEQLRGVAKPLVASLVMCAAILAARGLIADLSALARLSMLVPTGAAVFIGTICLIDMPLVKDLSGFALSSVQRQQRP